MRWLWALAAAAVCIGMSRADDWPMYKGNAARNGFTSQTLAPNLKLQWVARNVAPTPAWPASNRLGFDKAFHPVVAGSTLFFGSSADCHVHALDAATGKERWSFATGGPVRFAPAVWKDRLFAASDDGWLYCLACTDGKLLWKKQGGPDDRMILGNDRMISRWPARGGPVVFEDTVYFGAGIWPSEGIYLYALDAATGKVHWCNDKSGEIFMGQPHGGAYAASGVGCQGYLVVSDDQLLVPTGRAVPAVFERATGKFRYFHLQALGHKGGTATLAIGPYFFNAGFTYDASTGKILDPVGAGEVAATPEGLIVSNTKDLLAYRWADKKKAEKGKLELIKYKGLEKLWTIPGVVGGTALAVADKIVVCGSDGGVTLADQVTKKSLWSAEVDGSAQGLAVANGRLFVSTHQGTIYCFAPDAVAKPADLPAPAGTGVYGTNEAAAAAATKILEQSNLTEGYAVDLACGDGALAYELARRSKLHILAIDADADNVKLARQKLMAAGLYGVRVTVHHGDPGRTALPKYFAELVVSGRSLTEGPDVVPAREVTRVQRPFGGVAVLGKIDALRKTVRGPLEGAGQWTHQYADAANTCCSTDNLIQGPLGMLWFRDSDLESPSRHGRAPAPLVMDGRMFVEGTHGMRAVDAYNGRRLWEVSLPNILKPYQAEHLMGTAGTNSNFCITSQGLYVRDGSQCFRLDPATGKKLGTFDAPPGPDGKAAPWGYIASSDGLLFGSLANTSHVVKYTYGKSDMGKLFTESTALFALDPMTGKQRWTYKARHSLRHNAIAIGAGKVYLIDRPLAAKDLLAGPMVDEHLPGELVALEAATGKELWRKKEDIYGTTLALSTTHDVLLMSYQPTRFKLPSEVGGKLAGFKAATGERIWDTSASYVTRPLINGRTVYAQGVSLDLITGASKAFLPKRSYGCGQLSGSTHMMLFRSATLAYFDLLSPKGVIDYGGMRPGCWINAVPAGGIVLVPDATSGCQCSYLNQAWVALQPLE